MVLTATGLVAIEKLVAGDKVISTNADTLETAGKTVLETYVRQVDKLVHITVNGEEIVTTDNHPFYVQGRGFIEAGNLLMGDKLISVNSEDLIIEDYHIELTEEPVSVYNFQVEDFHTYFVGDCCVWVHNAECVGANGTQTPSKTLWQNGKTERVDVENLAPGKRDGNVHYHDPKNKKYYYDIKEKKFWDPKTESFAPPRIQKLLNDPKIMNGIKKGLKILNEK